MQGIKLTTLPIVIISKLLLHSKSHITNIHTICILLHNSNTFYVCLYSTFTDLLETLKPELIAPVVGWLCHEDCMDNGSVIESAGGWAGKCKNLSLNLSFFHLTLIFYKSV